MPLIAWDVLRHGDEGIERMFDRYGDVVWLRIPQVFEVLPGVSRVALLRDPALIKPLFTAPDELVDSTKANRVLEMLYGDRSLFLIDGPEHRRLRKLLLPPLRGAALEQWAETIVQTVEKEILTWTAQDSVRIHPRMLDVSLELILKVTLGVPDEELHRWMEPMHDLLTIAASEEMTIRYGLRRIGAMRRWRRFQSTLAACDELVFEEITRRRTANVSDQTDLLDLMLRAGGRPLTDRELRDQIFTILIAGHETSATTASWAIERLVRTPSAMARAVAAANTDEDHAYLEAVIHETLRVRPPVAAVGRVTRAPITLGDYHFPAHVLLAPVIRSVHRRAELYEDPERFAPERFLDTRPGVYTLIPFGGGAHRCLGDRFALFQTTLMLKTMLRCADLSPVDAADEQVKRKAIVYQPGNGVLIRARTAPNTGTEPR